MRLALFQPDIPQNLGAAMRLSACFDVVLEVIEPCAFPVSDKSLKRAAMDYAPRARILRHDGWTAFLAHPARQEGRLVLFTTRGATRLEETPLGPGDTLLFGRESAGVPDFVHEASDLAVKIPISADARSLNLSVSAGIALFEGLRANGLLPR
jgi:tRNA (cytidine/uridine-2'-O-)-methyltransferase